MPAAAIAANGLSVQRPVGAEPLDVHAGRRRPRAGRTPAAREATTPSSASVGDHAPRRPSRRARCGAARPRTRVGAEPRRPPRAKPATTASRAPSPIAWKPACRPASVQATTWSRTCAAVEVGVPGRGRRRRRRCAGRPCASRSRRRRTGRRPRRARRARGPARRRRARPSSRRRRAPARRRPAPASREVVGAGDVRAAELVQRADAELGGALPGGPLRRAPLVGVDRLAGHPAHDVVGLAGQTCPLSWTSRPAARASGSRGEQRRGDDAPSARRCGRGRPTPPYDARSSSGGSAAGARARSSRPSRARARRRPRRAPGERGRPGRRHSARLRASLRSRPASASPVEVACTCASTNAGVTSAPSRSTTCVGAVVVRPLRRSSPIQAIAVVARRASRSPRGWSGVWTRAVAAAASWSPRQSVSPPVVPASRRSNSVRTPGSVRSRSIAKSACPGT